MKNSHNKNTSQDTSRAVDASRTPDESRTAIHCSAPNMSALVSDYIFDLLDDAVAFEVEKHLAECSLCKEKYLTVLRSRRVPANQKPEEPDDDVDPKPQDDSEPLVVES